MSSLLYVPAVALLLSLLGIVLKMGTILGETRATLRSMEDGLAKVDATAARLERIPLLESRLDLLEDVEARIVSDISELKQARARADGIEEGRRSRPHFDPAE